jgi:hypothetical protein
MQDFLTNVTESIVARGQVWHFVPNNYYFWKIPFGEMPYFVNIL